MKFSPLFLKRIEIFSFNFGIGCIRHVKGEGLVVSIDGAEGENPMMEQGGRLSVRGEKKRKKDPCTRATSANHMVVIPLKAEVTK